MPARRAGACASATSGSSPRAAKPDTPARGPKRRPAPPRLPPPRSPPSPPTRSPTRPTNRSGSTPARSTTTASSPAPTTRSNQTAAPLLIWLHGCYGEAEGDAWVVDPDEEQDWLTLSLAGREGGAEGVCWIPSVDEAKVMAALADFETHFNVNRQRVILGRLLLRRRPRLPHRLPPLGHLRGPPDRQQHAVPRHRIERRRIPRRGDDEVPDRRTSPTKRTKRTHSPRSKKRPTKSKASGFPLTLIKRRGEHFNEPGEKVEGVAVPGTDADIRTYLLPYIDDGWLAPAP